MIVGATLSNIILYENIHIPFQLQNSEIDL